MNKLQTLTFDQHEIRILDRHGEPWFVAADVCRVLDIDTTQTRRLDEDEKGLCSIQTPGGSQDMICVNESGLYSLVLGSRKPEAKAFKRWVTHEVLPKIRRDGFYAMDTTDTPALPTDYLSALKALVAAEEAKQTQSEQLALQAPKVALYDVAMSAENAQPVATVAKALGIGPNKLFRWLREEKILMTGGTRHNQPYQVHLDAGRFVVREYSLTALPQGIVNKVQTLVTPKGLAYIHAQWKNAHPEAIANIN